MKPIVLKSILIFVALCFLSYCHKATVAPDNTVSEASSIPTLGIYTNLTDIHFTTTGATGIGPATGLPTGVTATWVANVITIRGTPTESGTFYYTIPLTGGSCTGTAKGTIIVLCDYLPLYVGAKYLYSYSGSYSYPGTYSIAKGECLWEFIERVSIPPFVYRVRQTLNGISITRYEYSTTIDTTLISNQIDTLTFNEDGNGAVKITFPVMYWGGYGSKIVERYLECSITDSCFYSTYYDEVCLSKNIGIRYLIHTHHSNHNTSASYALEKGPY